MVAASFYKAGADYTEADLAALEAYATAAAASATAAAASAAEAATYAVGALLIANDLSDLNSASTARTNLGVAIGSDVQAYDATLASIAALGTASDKMAYTTGVDTWAETALTSFARSILDDADEATFKATVNLEIGTDVQAYDATLASLSSLGTAADKMAYTTGVDTWAETAITSFGRSLIDDAAASNARTTLGLGSAAVEDTGTSGAVLPKLNGANTWSANQDFNYSKVDRALLDAYSEVLYANGTAGATVTIDLDNGNVQNVTFGQNCTVTLTNIGSNVDTLVLYTVSGGSYTITWPASVDWPSGTAPTLTTGVDALVFVTADSGTTWYGFASGLGMA